MNWQTELRELLDRVPGGAQRLIAAIDERRMYAFSFGYESECGTIACAYGHIYGETRPAIDAALTMRREQNQPEKYTALELQLIDSGAHAICAEVVVWLVENGTAPDPPVLHEVNSGD